MLKFAHSLNEYCGSDFDPHVRSAFVWAAFFLGFNVGVAADAATSPGAAPGVQFVSGLTRQYVRRVS